MVDQLALEGLLIALDRGVRQIAGFELVRFASQTLWAAAVA